MDKHHIRSLLNKRKRIPSRPKHVCHLIAKHQTDLLNSITAIKNEAHFLSNTPKGFADFKEGVLNKMDYFISENADLHCILIERLNHWEQHVDLLEAYIDDLQKALRQK